MCDARSYDKYIKHTILRIYICLFIFYGRSEAEFNSNRINFYCESLAKNETNSSDIYQSTRLGIFVFTFIFSRNIISFVLLSEILRLFN